jgi:2-iminobutanoate/2-iminopropanoate deaminase
MSSETHPVRFQARRILSSSLLALLLLSPLGLTAQRAELVYISNVSTTHAGGHLLTTVEAQTAATMDRLGEELRRQGLDYSHVVVSNVFLRDTRHFQGMNGIYRTYFQTDPPTRATVQADLLDPDALIQISVVAARGPKEVITPAGLKSPELPYSWGFKVANTLFISGATSRSPETYQPVAGDVPTQTQRVFGNIGMILEEAGMDFEDLVSCRVFLDDPRGFGAMNEAYGALMPAADPPARATVRAALMNPLFSTEIQCVAETSSQRRVVRPRGQASRPLPFSPGIDTGQRLYLAGVVGRGSDVEEETQAALDGIASTLNAASRGFGDVENVWVYLADIRDWEVVEGILRETLGEEMPEPTVVGSRLMGRSSVEIQMVAGG